MRVDNSQLFSVAETFEVSSLSWIKKQNSSERIDVKLCCLADYTNDRNTKCIISSGHNNTDVFEVVGADDNSFEVVDVVRLAGGRLAETRYYKTTQQIRDIVLICAIIY